MPEQQQDPRIAGVMEHLDQWWKNRTCHICGILPTWETDLTPYVAPEYAVLSQPAKVLAVISLMCSGCGHVELFGAAKIGAMMGLATLTATPAEETQAEMDPMYAQGTDANGSPVEEA